MVCPVETEIKITRFEFVSIIFALAVFVAEEKTELEAGSFEQIESELTTARRSCPVPIIERTAVAVIRYLSVFRHRS